MHYAQSLHQTRAVMSQVEKEHGLLVDAVDTQFLGAVFDTKNPAWLLNPKL